MLGNFTALVPVNNTPVVTLAGHAHAASWPHDSLSVSLDNTVLHLPNQLIDGYNLSNNLVESMSLETAKIRLYKSFISL